MNEHWSERIGESTLEEAITKAVAVQAVPGADLAALTGRQLFAAVLDRERRDAAMAEVRRRLTASGWLDVRGELRPDKCGVCGEVLGSALALARHKHERAPSVLDLLTAAGITDGGAVEAVACGQLAQTPALDQVQDWLWSGDAAALVLSGGAGCGKTWAAASAIGQHGGAWADAHEFGRLVSDDRLAQLCHSGGVVVIDDLGQEHLGARAGGLSVVDEITSARVGARRRLVVTTNLRPEDLRARYGERFWSRVAVVEVGGVDLRQPKETR